MINIEARGGELVAVLATKSKISIFDNSLDHGAGGDEDEEEDGIGDSKIISRARHVVDDSEERVMNIS